MCNISKRHKICGWSDKMDEIPGDKRIQVISAFGVYDGYKDDFNLNVCFEWRRYTWYTWVIDGLLFLFDPCNKYKV